MQNLLFTYNLPYVSIFMLMHICDYAHKRIKEF
jgi:hypothetical protein